MLCVLIWRCQGIYTVLHVQEEWCLNYCSPPLKAFSVRGNGNKEVLSQCQSEKVHCFSYSIWCSFEIQTVFQYCTEKKSCIPTIKRFLDECGGQFSHNFLPPHNKVKIPLCSRFQSYVAWLFRQKVYGHGTGQEVKSLSIYFHIWTCRLCIEMFVGLLRKG